MSWLLCEAVVRAQLRRAAAAARRDPMVAGVLLATWLAAPLAVARGARVAAEGLGPSLGDPEVVRAVAIGFALPSLAAGSALALSAAGVQSLGLQLATAPVMPRALAAATLGPTLVVAGLLVAPLAMSVALPLAAATPAGDAACLAVLAALLATVVVGGLIAEMALRAVRTGRALALVPAVAVLALLLALIELLARALAAGGVSMVVGTTLAACAIAGAGAPVLPALVAGRPPRRPSFRPAAIRPLASAPPLCTLQIAGRVLGRRQEVRLALGVGVVFGLAGGVTGTAGARSAAVGVLLGGASAVLAASLAPLAVGGRLEAARWAWRLGARGSTAAAWSAGGACLMVGVVTPVAVLGLLLGAPAATLAPLLALAGLACGAALVAGAVVPRGSSGALEDAAALGLLAALTAALAGLASAAQPLLESARLPGPAATVLLFAGVAVLGVGSLSALVLRRR